MSCVCMCIYIYINTYTHTYCIYVYIYIYMVYIHMYVHMCVCICIYTLGPLGLCASGRRAFRTPMARGSGFWGHQAFQGREGLGGLGA